MMIGRNIFRLCIAAAIGVVTIGNTGAAAVRTLAAAQSRTSAQSTYNRGKENASYYPLALGNWWLYTVKDSSKKATTTVKWKVAHRETEASYGADAYQLSSTPVQSDEPMIVASRENGIVEPDTGNVLLKTPLQTGDRWSDRGSFSPNTYEVISAGKPCVAGGHRFKDCAIVREVNEEAGLLTLKTYARGVGPVAFVYYKGVDSKAIDSTLTIQSWHVR